MPGSCMRSWRPLAALLALVLAVTAPSARAQENRQRPEAKPTDIVLLVDVSGSMRRHDGLVRARRILLNVLDKVAHPGARVALIPFGTGVHDPVAFDVPHDATQAQAVRRRMAKAIEGIRAGDSYTYLYEGIHVSIETLRRFKAADADHARRIILISDGRQLTRRGENTRTLRGIIEHFEQLGFRKRDDWFIWYCHFGEADDTLRRLLEETGAGRVVSLDDLPTLEWAYTSLQPEAIQLGNQPPGSWSVKTRLVALTDEEGVGRMVRLGIDPRGLPEGMRLEVAPQTLRLDARRTEVDVTLSCAGARPGEFRDSAITVAAEEGTLHWISTERLGLRFTVVRPRVRLDVARLDLGRLAPGGRVSRDLTLSPDPGARLLAAPVRARLVGVPGSLAAGLDRDEVTSDRRTRFTLTVAVPPRAREGVHEWKVRFEGGDAVEVVPAEVAVRLSVGLGHVTLDRDRLSFGTLLAGRAAEREIALTTDAETARAGGALRVTVEGLPDGVRVEAPTRVELKAGARLALRLETRPNAAAGEHEAWLRIEAPEGVQVEPARLPLGFRVILPGKLGLPSVVDLGDVPASKAREVTGSLEVAVNAHLAGAELEFVRVEGEATLEPRVVTLERGATKVPVRLRSVRVEPGERICRFEAFLLREGERRREGTVLFRWRVRETYLQVRNWGRPAALPAGGGEAKSELVLDSSTDLRGATLRLASSFGALATGMSVELTTSAIELKGGLQTVPVRFLVRDARPGRYRGALRLGLDREVEGLALPDPLDVSLEVAGATVYAALEGGLLGLEPGQKRELKLVLTASGVPLPAEVRLALDRAGLPDGVRADLPATVRIENPDGVLRVPLAFTLASAVAPGEWTPRLNLTCSRDDVALDPSRLELRAGVPETVTLVRGEKRTWMPWIVAGACLLAFLVTAAFVIMRRKPKVVQVSLTDEPEDDLEGLGDLVIEDDEVYVFEDFDDGSDA